MAETSTRLLDSERASIFLWDKTNRVLIGRPALGVEDGELRIPDSQGIVGQVVQSNEVRRVDESERDAIARDVDQQLGFHTHSLLCVPLRGSDGKVLGAFEMINKREGNFTKEDEIGLTELASHAAIALENTQHVQQLLESKKQLAQQAADQVQLIGKSVAIEQLRTTVTRVADTDPCSARTGRERDGKRSRQPARALPQPATERAVYRRHCAALTENAVGKRAVWSRERCLHRCP